MSNDKKRAASASDGLAAPSSSTNYENAPVRPASTPLTSSGWPSMLNNQHQLELWSESEEPVGDRVEEQQQRQRELHSEGSEQHGVTINSLQRSKFNHPAPRKTVARKMAPRVRKTTRAGLVLPVSRVERMLKEGTKHRVMTEASVFLTATLEYLVAEVVELAGDAAATFNKKRIIPRHIQLAIQGDKELAKLLNHVVMPEAGVVGGIHPSLLPKKRSCGK